MTPKEAFLGAVAEVVARCLIPIAFRAAYGAF